MSAARLDFHAPAKEHIVGDCDSFQMNIFRWVDRGDHLTAPLH